MYDTPWQLRTPALCSTSATHMLPTLPSHQCMQEMDSYVNLPKQSLLLNNQLVALKVTIIVHLHLSKRFSFLSGRDVIAIVPSFSIFRVVNNSFLFLRSKIRAKQTHVNNVKYQHPTFSAVMSLKAHGTWAPYPPLIPAFHPMLFEDLGPAI